MEVSYRYFIPVKYFPEEGGHAGIRSWVSVHCAVLRMPIEEFQPTEIPWEIDTSHRSSSQKRWTERERERERGEAPLLSERGASQGKFSGRVAQIQAANGMRKEGRLRLHILAKDLGLGQTPARAPNREYVIPSSQTCPKLSKLLRED